MWGDVEGGGDHADEAEAEIQRGEGFAVLRVRGELDLKAASVWRSRLVELVAEYPVVVVDLDGADYIDSSGLGTLMVSHRVATQRGNRLAVVCSVPRFRRAFELRGLDPALPVYSTLGDALQGGAEEPGRQPPAT